MENTSDYFQIKFSDFIYCCIQSRLDPREFYNLTSSCYSILKWILINNQVSKNKADLHYYYVLVDYLKELKIYESPNKVSEDVVHFYCLNDEIDRCKIAKVCLNLFESYIKFYLDNKKTLELEKNPQSYYLQMEIHLKNYKQIQETLFNNIKPFKEKNAMYFLSDEELQSEVIPNTTHRQFASKKVKKYYLSIIKGEQTILEKEKSKEQNSSELNEYRGKMIQKSIKEMQNFQQQNQQYPIHQTVAQQMNFSDFVHSSIKQRLDPNTFYNMISSCYSILKSILIKNGASKNKIKISFYPMIENFLKELKIIVKPQQGSETLVNFYGSNYQIDRCLIAKVCLTLYEQYIKFYLENKKNLASGMNPNTFYLQMEIHIKNYQQRQEKIQIKPFNQENAKYFMNDEELQSNVDANINNRQLADKTAREYFISIINKTDQVKLVNQESQESQIFNENEESNNQIFKQVGDKGQYKLLKQQSDLNTQQQQPQQQQPQQQQPQQQQKKSSIFDKAKSFLQDIKRKF